MLSWVHSSILLSSIFLVILISNYFYLKYKATKLDKIQLMNNIMGCVFILFGFLKIINLDKFVKIFNKYDIISQKIPQYAYVYPLIEIALGISYLKKYRLTGTNFTTLFLMIISIISVSVSLYNGQKLRCGCLGSFLHIPLSYVTLSENVVMSLMSASYFLQSG